MLDNIQAQLKRNEVFTRMNFYNHQRTTEAIQLSGDFYPLMMEYYHEMNPAFIYYMNPENIDLLPAFTVRDGALVLGNYILKNFQSIPSLRTHFYIARNLAYLIPDNLRSHFSAWHIYQEKKIGPHDAKIVFISAILSDLNVDLESVRKKLEVLKDFSKDCKVELFLPQRRSGFGMPWTESHLAHEIVELVKDYFPKTKLQNMKMREVLDRTSWKDIYAIDLLEDSIVLADSFLNHFIAARGGTVSAFADKGLDDHFFELDLSLNHKIQFAPLPQVKNIFADMVFYKKKALSKDPLVDPNFHLLLKQKNF